MADYAILSRKEFVNLVGPSTKGAIFRELGGPIVFYPPHPSTGTRLHEMYHAEISPNKNKGSMGSYEYALEEINAIQFTREHKGKSGILFNDVIGLGNGMLDTWRPGEIMGAVLKALNKSGIGELSQEQRNELWWYLKKQYTDKRKVK